MKPMEFHIYVADNGGVTISASPTSSRPLAAFGNMAEATEWLTDRWVEATRPAPREAGPGAPREPAGDTYPFQADRSATAAALPAEGSLTLKGRAEHARAHGRPVMGG